MKHLLFDINIILDLWLKRGEYEVIDKLLAQCVKLNIRLWFSSSSIGTVDYILVRELTKEGASLKFAKDASKELLSILFEEVSLLSNFGFNQHLAVQNAHDLEDAQIAVAFDAIHGPKRIVTNDSNFDTLGLVKTVSPKEALDWIKEDIKGPIAFIDLKTQQDALRPQLEENIHKVFQHGRYILGPEVKELEAQLCQYTGAKHCIGVSSGTDALLMPLMAWNIGPGDAVFTTPFTFIATAEVIQLLGATPVFVDIDPETFNIDPKSLELAIKAVQENNSSIYPLPKTKTPLTPKVVIPVDLFGLPADYDIIMEIAEKYDLKVLSDSAQGFGSIYKGKKSGTLGHATATSFFPAKPLGGYGDGGAIFTHDDELYDLLESIRLHGKGKDKYDNIRIGLNARLDTLQAAILLPKLERFPLELKKKQKVAEKYTKYLSKLDEVTPPQIPKGLKSAWAQYSVLAKDSAIRKKIQNSLKDRGIPNVVYYPKPLHMQTAFMHLGYNPEDFQTAFETSKRIFSLPMHAYLMDAQIKEITSVIFDSLQ